MHGRWNRLRRNRQANVQRAKRRSEPAEDTQPAPALRRLLHKRLRNPRKRHCLASQYFLHSRFPQTAPTPNLPSKSLVRARWSFLTLILAAICVTAALAFWPGNASPCVGFLAFTPYSVRNPLLLADVNKPTYTPAIPPLLRPLQHLLQPRLRYTLYRYPTPLILPLPRKHPARLPLPGQPIQPSPLPTEHYRAGGQYGWRRCALDRCGSFATDVIRLRRQYHRRKLSWSRPEFQFPTVTGQYHIYMKFVSTTYGGDGYYLPDVPYTMYFYKGYGIHGTYWHNNFGHPMSHGCVNMYTPDAEWMFYWASVGTLVNVHY